MADFIRRIVEKIKRAKDVDSFDHLENITKEAETLVGAVETLVGAVETLVGAVETLEDVEKDLTLVFKCHYCQTPVKEIEYFWCCGIVVCFECITILLRTNPFASDTLSWKTENFPYEKLGDIPIKELSHKELDKISQRLDRFVGISAGLTKFSYLSVMYQLFEKNPTYENYAWWLFRINSLDESLYDKFYARFKDQVERQRQARQRALLNIQKLFS